jgi:uncharacterized protein HemX
MEDNRSETGSVDASEATAARRQFDLPFALVLAALLVYFGFETMQLLAQRSELSALKRSQEGAIEVAQKVHQQFNAIMTKIDELAKQGHVGATMVLESLQKSAGSEQKPNP